MNTNVCRSYLQDKGGLVLNVAATRTLNDPSLLDCLLRWIHSEARPNSGP